MRQDAAAVAGREDARNHLQTVFAEDRHHFFQTLQVIRRLEVDGIEAGCEQDTVESVLRRRSGYLSDVVDILLRAEPARDVDPAVREDFLAGPADARQEQLGQNRICASGYVCY